MSFHNDKRIIYIWLTALTFLGIVFMMFSESRSIQRYEEDENRQTDLAREQRIQQEEYLWLSRNLIKQTVELNQ